MNELDEKIANIMNSMNLIRYGWVDKNNVKYSAVDEGFADKYILQSPHEVVKSRVGVCWDQVELERFLFSKNNIACQTYCLIYYDQKKCPTHTFLVYKNKQKFYWFEHAWEKFRGIHAYNNLRELLKDVKTKFIETDLSGKFNDLDLVLYEYSQPDSHLSVRGFYGFVEKSKQVIL